MPSCCLVFNLIQSNKVGENLIKYYQINYSPCGNLAIQTLIIYMINNWSYIMMCCGLGNWGLVKWGCVCVWPPACVCSFFLWNQVKNHLPSLSVNDTIRLSSDCWYKTSSPSTPSQTLSSAPDLLPWTSHLHDDCKLLHLISYSKLLNPLGLYGLHYTYTCLHPPELHAFRLWWWWVFFCCFFPPPSDLQTEWGRHDLFI